MNELIKALTILLLTISILYISLQSDSIIHRKLLDFSLNDYEITIKGKNISIIDYNDDEIPELIKPKEADIDPTCNNIKRHYLPDHIAANYTPSLLYSFPGSGNTWVRLLIEYSTGVYTGSFFHDHSLYEIMPGEHACNKSVAVVKAHPNIQKFYTHIQIPKYAAVFKNKCYRNRMRYFDKGILLIRDPFDAIFSEFQRENTKSHHAKLLNTLIIRDKVVNHINETLLPEYIDMWDNEYQLFMESSKYIVVKYEDLKDPNKRIDILNNIISFLNLPRSYYDNLSDNDKLKRLECAFMFSDLPDIHRPSDYQTSAHLLLKSDVYNKSFVCYIWNRIKEYVAKYDYKPYNNTEC